METRVLFIPTNDRPILAYRASELDRDRVDLTRERAEQIALFLYDSGLYETGRKSRVFLQTARRAWDLWHDPYDESLADAHAKICAATPS